MAGREITRRDFLNGVQVAVTGAALAPFARLAAAAGPQLSPVVPPPAQTGMRGSHDGSWEVAHALVSGRRFEPRADARRDEVDLVVVGAGISGLAAAWFYRRARPGARILILDNHEDFGGHATRNEFELDGRRYVGYGGTESIDGPAGYSEVARGLLRELGIDLGVFRRAFDERLYPSLGLSVGVFFDRETFGSDRLVAGYGTLPWPEFAARTPLPERARRDLVRLHTEKRDYLPGLSRDEKVALLERTSYEQFLLRHARVAPELVDLYRRVPLEYMALGADGFPAYWVSQEPIYPGLDGTLVERARAEEPYIYHFPDGNASIARLLVASLAPHALPARTLEEALAARPSYGLLDVDGAAVRIRLASTAVDVRHDPEGRVLVRSVRDGRVEVVRARDCVLACWNAVIPYLCPELPERQRRALAYAVKAPLVYVNVLLRRWQAFVAAGVHEAYAPNTTYAFLKLDFPVSLGPVRAARRPEEPIVLHLVHVPHHPELAGAEQWRAGRRDLLATSFATFEARLREQLARMLGPSGFDGDAEIAAITVNRWPHGYAYSPNTLWDPDWASEDEQPWVIGRQRHGRIAIANSDAAATAFTDAAIDQAYRAVGELLGEE